ncbi:D-Ala-D-Ala carboxypeptidase family metallohydrolase [Ruegeria atlantica]|uniref:D-Ala-D-Ala carboxypeptidase family metallohydrolase n=1 Tax=Ruegeria atlantica TaxID=81569 RepID=UPI001C2C0405|nr:D-Ala-D-Ala carboxypeptidase family metallohydrolase [Ruegeria atlantica]
MDQRIVKKLEAYSPNDETRELTAKLYASQDDPRMPPASESGNRESRDRTAPALNGGFSLVDGGSITITIDVPSNQCNPAQAQHNASVLQFAQERTMGLVQIRAAALSVNEQSKHGAALEAAIHHFNSTAVAHTIEYWLCLPSGVTIQEEQAKFIQHYAWASEAARAAHAWLFNNAEEQLSSVYAELQNIDRARLDFDQMTTGNPGLKALNAAIEKAKDELNKVFEFDFGKWNVPQHDNRAKEFWERAASVSKQLDEKSWISELDRLRDEYAQYGMYVPREHHFIKAIPGFHLWIPETYNKGDYSYFIASNRIVLALDNIFQLLSNQGHYFGFTIESGYRNPKRNVAVGGVPNSRHAYGDAADLNAIDYNNNGAVDSEDLKNLETQMRTQNFDFVQPKTYTVHAEYKQGLGF